MKNAIIKISVVAWCKKEDYIELLTIWNTSVRLYGDLGKLLEIIAAQKDKISIYGKAEKIMSKDVVDSNIRELQEKGFIKVWDTEELFNCLFA